MQLFSSNLSVAKAHNLCKANNIEELSRYLALKPHLVNEKSSKNRRTCLHIAAIQSTEMVLMLLLRGGDINAIDRNGNTPLLLAIERGRDEIASTLILRGASLSIRNKQLQTPLHVACQYNCIQIVPLLLQNQADINTIDSNGNTPLLSSMKQGYIELSILLIDMNADYNIIDRDFQSAYAIAVSKCYENMVDFIKEKQGYMSGRSPALGIDGTMRSYKAAESSDKKKSKKSKKNKKKRKKDLEEGLSLTEEKLESDTVAKPIGDDALEGRVAEEVERLIVDTTVSKKIDDVVDSDDQMPQLTSRYNDASANAPFTSKNTIRPVLLPSNNQPVQTRKLYQLCGTSPSHRPMEDIDFTIASNIVDDSNDTERTGIFCSSPSLRRSSENQSRRSKCSVM